MYRRSAKKEAWSSSNIEMGGVNQDWEVRLVVRHIFPLHPIFTFYNFDMNIRDQILEWMACNDILPQSSIYGLHFHLVRWGLFAHIILIAMFSFVLHYVDGKVQQNIDANWGSDICRAHFHTL